MHKYLVHNPVSTFFAWASGDSMIGIGVYDGDLLIVDRSLEPINKSVVIATLEGEMTIKTLLHRGKRLVLAPENPAYPEFEVMNPDDLTIWGVVKHAVHTFRHRR